MIDIAQSRFATIQQAARSDTPSCAVSVAAFGHRRFIDFLFLEQLLMLAKLRKAILTVAEVVLKVFFEE